MTSNNSEVGNNTLQPETSQKKLGKIYELTPYLT